MYGKFCEVWSLVFEICERTHRHEIAILHIPHGGEVIIIIVIIIIIIITRSIGTVPTSAKTRLTSVTISVPPSGELVRDQHQLNEQLYSPRQRAQCKRKT